MHFALITADCESECPPDYGQSLNAVMPATPLITADFNGPMAAGRQDGHQELINYYDAA